MQFIVCEQRSTDTAMVHRCNCKTAQGQEKRSLDLRVHGPFTTGEQAITAAGRTGALKVKVCGSCRP